MGMIPEAAVEAAAEWLPHSGDCEARPERGCTCWRSRVDLMSAALEAAAPHMLAGLSAQVWDEAMTRAAEIAWEHDASASSAITTTPNPYGPTP
jgi:hypothetical protein